MADYNSKFTGSEIDQAVAQSLMFLGETNNNKAHGIIADGEGGSKILMALDVSGFSQVQWMDVTAEGHASESDPYLLVCNGTGLFDWIPASDSGFLDDTLKSYLDSYISRYLSEHNYIPAEASTEIPTDASTEG